MKQLSIIFIFLGISIVSFGQNYFQKTFGDSTLQEKGALVHQTTDGTIYYVGNKQSNTNSTIEFFKMTASGQIILQQELQLNRSLFVNAMLFEGDKFLLVGEQRYLSSSNVDGFALFMDTIGQVIQIENYGLSGKTEVFKSVIKGQNGAYIINGFTTAQNNVGNDFYLTGLTQNLIQEWEVSNGSPLNDVGQKAIQLPNGNVLVIGDQVQSSGNSNIYGQFYSADGRFISDFVIPEIYNGGSKSLILDANNDIVIIGEMSSSSSVDFDIYMVKLDLNGHLIWKKYLTNTMTSDAGFALIQPNNHTYLVTGYAVGPVSQTQDIILLSTDTSGNVLEQKFYGATGVEIAYNIYPSVNGGFLIAGFDNVVNDIQYFLIYDNINLAVNTQSIQPIKSYLNIFPNPITQQSFSFNELIENAKISIINLNGQVLESGFITNNDTYQLKNQLPSGNYFVNLQFENFQKTISIIIK